MVKRRRTKKDNSPPPPVEESYNVVREFNDRNSFSMVAIAKSLQYMGGSLLLMITSGYMQLFFVNTAMLYNEIPILPDIPISDDMNTYIRTLNEKGRAYAGSPRQVGLWENPLEKSVSLFAAEKVYPMDFDINNGVGDDEVTAIINTTLNVDLYGGNLEMLGGDHQAAFDATVDQVSYTLATAKHESDFFNTLREYGGPGYLKYLDGRLGNRWYHIHGDNEFGEPDYVTYSGTGLVQTTGRENFRKVGMYLKKLGFIDDDMFFVNNPKALEEPQWAALALVIGMRDGWYTDLSLRDYILADTDFVQARRIVNGMDQASLIANYAKGYRAMVEKRYKQELSM